MPRDVTISLHVTEDQKRRIQDAALAADRSVNDWLNHRIDLALALEDDGYILRRDGRLRKIRNGSE